MEQVNWKDICKKGKMMERQVGWIFELYHKESIVFTFPDRSSIYDMCKSLKIAKLHF